MNSQQLRLPFLDARPWRVAVVGAAGRYARNQVATMIAAGTPITGGVALGRGGTSLDGVPLYDRVADLPELPTIALIYTPAEGVRDAIAECAGARIPTIMAVAEYVPVHDTLAAAAFARAAGSWLVGPNTLGIFVPDVDCWARSRRASAAKGGWRLLSEAVPWRLPWRGS
jgi:succinyl-CoA synthetase alpha subunit